MNIRRKVNAYLGMLAITFVASGAVMIIVHVTFSGNLTTQTVVIGSEASYASLKKTLLK